ncbi:MAG: ABC transporter ATP-binding protein [Nitrospinae bacterium]|nr:ABC transporter ATP-binding protein [Nitrospinota bacterium]
MNEGDKQSVPLLEGVEISKNYITKAGSLDVLADINLSVNSGEVLGIIGASGVGKSTLMHILGGLDKPSSGKVLFNGENIFNRNNAFLDRFRNNNIGFVFQSFNLLNDFTALENTMFPLLIAKMGKKKAREKAEHLLSQVGLKDRLDHKPGELSGGESQRVALARGLINDPDVLLADEPTGNLDSRTSESLMELFRKLNQENKQTFVIVTHSQKIAKSLDRILQLAEGVLRPIDKDLII